MPSFTALLNNLRHGGASLDSVLESLDHELRLGDAEPDHFLEVLDREQAEDPLPDDVFITLRRQIHITQTSLRTAEAARDPDATHRAEQTPRPSAGGSGQSLFPERKPPKGLGDVLNGRFILEELIAKGGMSLVYRAIDQVAVEARSRDPYLALKVMNVVEARQKEAFMALQREVQKCRGLYHQNIVRVYDFARDGETVFMTMEYLRGENLAKKIPKFPLPDALGLITQMGEALAYAHGHGIIHADFKPGNVMVTDKGAVKVIDFGIARAYRAAGDTDTTETVFDAGVLRAMTLAYASPEMIEDQEPDPRDDIYALGCVAYELLAGKHPWGGVAATKARDTGKVLPKPDVLDVVHWRAIKGALAFDRDKRTPTVQQFLHQLTTPPLQRSPRPALPWKVIGLGTALTVLILAGAIAAWWYFPSPPTADVRISTIQDCPTCPRLHILPAGSASIGAAPGAGVFPFESPEHVVTLAAPIALAEHETTVDEFRAFANDVGFEPKACRSVENGWRPSDSLSWSQPGFVQTGDHPVTCVSWNDAIAYTQWLSKRSGKTYRLPSEAEWEFSARSNASNDNPSAAAKDSCSQSNGADQAALRVYPSLTVAACDDGFVYTAPVTSDAPGSLGLTGLTGNVFEWTLDCWNPNYTEAPPDGRPWVAGDCSQHVLRGGSWFTAPSERRLTFRNRFDADYRSNTFGFRVARDLR